MNKYRIAIEEGLSNIEEILREEGYDVRELDDGGAGGRGNYHRDE